MCTPEKKALVWSTYLNAQYQALWNIANTCDDSDEEKCRFYRAFATFEYSTSGDSANAQGTSDIVTFDEPKLVFICNHAVILTLSVKEGSLTNLSTEDGDAQAEIPLSDKQASFRMSFTRTHVTGRDSKIDDQAADHEVRMVVFDFEKATLITEHEVAVENFFRAYLQFLRLAGHHVLFGFPDFTDKKVLESLPVDYAILARTDEELEKFCREITYFNLSITQINDYVQYIQYERAEARAQEKKEALVASIVRVRWTKEATVIFDIKFGIPVVKALCPHEILFVFTLDEITQLEKNID
ncbi:hypothetical protein PHLGIDRAFT_379080 [Phlebiopsis gigantea 11061_1 CR5-6]|uniref:Uncharacterized protein n=1 Tax=Phlebiopsis gigantea (strain 11061_1 CR5-6) TaxID=745531 RepID=A0A0C3S0N7_PHLG1|nr:hypothetical protein PHLGIDRAFT_379080 [Phlebiopsis gigantea 11061_1 CR5-6]